MKQYILLFLFIATYSWSSFACEITSYSHIIINQDAKPTISETAFIEKSNCESPVNNFFNSLILNSNGSLNSKQISFLLQEKFPASSLSISPTIIKIYDLNEFVKLNFEIDTQIQPTNTSFLSKQGHANCKQIHIPVQESSIKNTGAKNINFNCDNSTQWLSSQFLRYRSVFKLNNNVSAFSSLDKNMVTTETVLVSDDDNLFTDLENLAFYKANKNLANKNILYSKDLAPINLTSYGKEIQLFVKSRNVVIKSRAISRGNGGINDLIQINNPITKKNISGKLTGFNEVTIEL